MSLSSLFYNFRQGFKNIWRNRMFSMASITTMAACILLFSIFFSILINVNYIIRTLEEEVGISVLFDEGTTDERIKEIGLTIMDMEHVTDISFTSAEEAWEEFSREYFEGNEELAESFGSDNPLAYSASYTVHVDEIEFQSGVVAAIEKLENVRKVNQSASAVNTLIGFNTLVTYGSIAIIAILLVVAVFLISNTVSIGISVRRHEIAIMKYIGATDSFVRAPFIVEGFLLGAIGAAIPLVIMIFAYDKLIGFVLTRFEILATLSSSLPTAAQVFQTLIPVGLALGVGIGLFGSIITVRKHLSV
ncbi:MAG: permease-like cell division protein FtsX [Lachnospiraceae bacterium]|nr:permease-like cell division protein FtsX [Lachnospiraceae bacterium]